ncbi:hypothetical protein FA09DRAFT_136618 [Tilletiopsis washingtonensis]|uniref:Uncharacterized protein n=1 Tax=Tilletiopsis washingtonensis TaxID=58919 RepID=A0A316Z2R5_9BASI|nr:hypothetical protein FA09DRAFT_136618 [Tilletiopsis washingtonensis]PWN95666.1 hypothetical protein FA09DRAFT_136618 [Tilletiopsis washingtonensis]
MDAGNLWSSHGVDAVEASWDGCVEDEHTRRPSHVVGLSPLRSLRAVPRGTVLQAPACPSINMWLGTPCSCLRPRPRRRAEGQASAPTRMRSSARRMLLAACLAPPTPCRLDGLSVAPSATPTQHAEAHPSCSGVHRRRSSRCECACSRARERGAGRCGLAVAAAPWRPAQHPSLACPCCRWMHRAAARRPKTAQRGALSLSMQGCGSTASQT